MVAFEKPVLPLGIGKWNKSLHFGAKKQMPGHKVRIWKQDPSVKEPGVRTAYLHTPIATSAEGLKDDMIEIRGMDPVSPDKDGNFLLDPKTDTKDFDSVHTLSVVRQVVTMFQRAMDRMNTGKDIEWQWGNKPINVYPHAGKRANAYYSRNRKEMKFFYFDPSKKNYPDRVYTTRSFDIVSHETGHAILDGMKPGFLSSWNPQTGGLHESFGDMSAIFTMLSQMDQCEAIIAESKANLHDKDAFFTKLAEEFGEALGRPMGLRNAKNDLKMSDVSNEVHDISRVFTGAVYDVMADMFDDKKDFDKEDPALTLFQVGRHMNDLVVASLLQVPGRNATYSDVAEKMIDLEPNPKWKEFIRREFTQREVLGPNAQEQKVPQAWDLNGTCPTMQSPEFEQSFNQALAEAQQNPLLQQERDQVS